MEYQCAFFLKSNCEERKKIIISVAVSCRSCLDPRPTAIWVYYCRDLLVRHHATLAPPARRCLATGPFERGSGAAGWSLELVYVLHVLASILYNLISRIYENVLSCFLNTDVADFLLISEILSCVVVWVRGVFIFPCNPWKLYKWGIFWIIYLFFLLLINLVR